MPARCTAVPIAAGLLHQKAGVARALRTAEGIGDVGIDRPAHKVIHFLKAKLRVLVPSDPYLSPGLG